MIRLPGRRVGAAVAGAVLSTFAVTFAGGGVGFAQAAAPPNVLTMNGSSVISAPYQGTQPQSFNLVKQNDGSWGIRHKYSTQVLTMNGSSVTGAPYQGTQPQSFNLVKQNDGSWGIRHKYSTQVLTMNGSSVTGASYQGTQPQSFQLIKQNDGSWGIRAFYGGDRLLQEPKAFGDAAVTEAGSSVTVDVLANDAGTGTSTSEGLRVTSVTAPTNGTATIQNGKVVYTPNAGHTGCDSFTYTTTDEFDQTSTVTAHVATGAINQQSQPGPITGTAVTVNGSSVTGEPYQAGNAAQTFTLVKQNDGSWGLRNQGTASVLTMNGSTVTGAAYQGSTGQSFSIVAQNDGSTGIRNTYSNQALTLTGTAVSGSPYSGSQPQSLQLVSQGDAYVILAHYGGTQVPQTSTARNDAAPTRQGAAVVVDVLANDNNAGSTTPQGLQIQSVTQPANGTA
ncbi:Ig-like domain-containing protein [Streptosporangium longisporum]|uniref:Ig-like domain-containing protein n=1 Tax=Streptosporangium longisporum TaxID=46187 RepID=UPI0031F11495